MKIAQFWLHLHLDHVPKNASGMHEPPTVVPHAIFTISISLLQYHNKQKIQSNLQKLVWQISLRISVIKSNLQKIVQQIS